MRMGETLDRRHVLSLSVLLAAAVGCGGGDAGPTKTETFTGVFDVIHSIYLLGSFDGDVDATLTWTVPALGTRPIAVLSFIDASFPDRVQARSAPSATPPITLKGSGTTVLVSCSNCNAVTPPVPFTLTLTGR